MPQASDELRGLMDKLFNNGGINDHEPTEFLKSRGYKLRSDWQWELPSTDHHITEQEELCLRFLVEEWDFGWIHEPK